MKEKGNQEALLSPLEAELYDSLRRNAGQVVSRETLLRNVWGFQSLCATRTVDMCVRRLREKIGSDRIQSVYGKGYILVA